VFFCIFSNIKIEYFSYRDNEEPIGFIDGEHPFWIIHILSIMWILKNQYEESIQRINTKNQYEFLLLFEVLSNKDTEY
jgi:hypothetical protein